MTGPLQGHDLKLFIEGYYLGSGLMQPICVLLGLASLGGAFAVLSMAKTA